MIEPKANKDRVSIKVSAEFFRLLKQEQFRQYQATGAEPTYDALLLEAWRKAFLHGDAADESNRTEESGRLAGFVPVQVPADLTRIVQQFVAFYLQANPGIETDFKGAITRVLATSESEKGLGPYTAPKKPPKK